MSDFGNLKENLLDPNAASLNDEPDEDIEGGEAVDAQMQGMDQSIDTGEVSDNVMNAVAGATNQTADYGDAYKNWHYIWNFNTMDAILSKAASSDNLMLTIQTKVSQLIKLSSPVGENSQLGGDAKPVKNTISEAIQDCQKYIDKKNPWFKKGKLRKQAVINLKSALEAVSRVDDVTLLKLMSSDYLMGTTEEDSKHTEERSKYGENIESAMNRSAYTIGSAKRHMAGRGYGNIDDNTARIIVQMQQNKKFAHTAEAGEFVNLQKPDADKSQQAKSMDAVIDVILAKNPLDLYLSTPDKFEPGVFVANLRFLEFTNGVFTGGMLDNYINLLPTGVDLGHRRTFKELTTNLYFYTYLLPIYRSVAGILMNPNYANAGPKIFKLLKLSAEDLRKLKNNIRERGDSKLSDAVEQLSMAKDSMNQTGFEFGGDPEDLLATALVAADDRLKGVPSYCFR